MLHHFQALPWPRSSCLKC
ncbi:hypothetical protein LINGRAHAP2_LOCUS24801 [Linum grandiflorum]